MRVPIEFPRSNYHRHTKQTVTRPKLPEPCDSASATMPLVPDHKSWCSPNLPRCSITRGVPIHVYLGSPLVEPALARCARVACSHSHEMKRRPHTDRPPPPPRSSTSEANSDLTRSGCSLRAI